jgi:hypothetical protein
MTEAKWKAPAFHVSCSQPYRPLTSLLSAYTGDEQRQTAETPVREVTRSVSEILGPLVDPSILDAFRAELDTLFQDAMMLWRGAQYSTVKFDATIEDSEESG